MNTAAKHFKIINSKTGYVIYYFSLSADLEAEQLKLEIDKTIAQVAIKNGLYRQTIYWEEIKDAE
jgi:hypothetical protein